MPLQELYDGPAGNAWRYFDELSAIPRPSKHEEKTQEWLLVRMDDPDAKEGG